MRVAFRVGNLVRSPGNLEVWGSGELQCSEGIGGHQTRLSRPIVNKAEGKVGSEKECHKS